MKLVKLKEYLNNLSDVELERQGVCLLGRHIYFLEDIRPSTTDMYYINGEPDKCYDSVYLQRLGIPKEKWVFDHVNTSHTMIIESF